MAGYLAGTVTIETLAGIRGIAVAELAAEIDEAEIAPCDGTQELTALTDEDLADAGDFIDLSWLDEE